jgi:hypothetical protein
MFFTSIAASGGMFLGTIMFSTYKHSAERDLIALASEQ